MLARPRRTGSWYGKRNKNENRSPLKEAVIYARVSTPDQQREGYSIPSQLKLLEDYAALNGIMIVSQHVDVETARKSGRTAFGDMLRYLGRHPQVRTLLVEKTDRLYRNLKDWGTIDDLGLEIHFVKENVVMSDTCRSSEKFVHGIKVLMAKAYVDNLSEETRKGMLEKAQQGIWPSFAPVGYRNVVDAAGRKVIVPDPTLGPLVSRLFDWFSTGNYSIKDVTAKARAAGLVYRKSGKPIGVSMVHHVLRNRLYTGAFDWLGVTYDGVHEPLTPTALWQEVQDILDRRSWTNVRAASPDFLFRGLIKCGHCGCALVAQIKKAKYIYYRCSGYKGKCPERFVRQEALEEHFVTLLRRLGCTKLAFASIRRSIDTGGRERSGAEVSAIPLHGRGQLPGTPGGLVHDGVALLDMGRTAWLSFAALADVMKREILDLLLAHCSWANGELTATFKPPFDILADYATAIRRTATLEGGKGVYEPLLDRFGHALQHPTSDMRRLIARYNAMVRIQREEATRRSTGQGRRPISQDDWGIEAEAA